MAHHKIALNAQSVSLSAQQNFLSELDSQVESFYEQNNNVLESLSHLEFTDEDTKSHCLRSLETLMNEIQKLKQIVVAFTQEELQASEGGTVWKLHSLEVRMNIWQGDFDITMEEFEKRVGCVTGL